MAESSRLDGEGQPPPPLPRPDFTFPVLSMAELRARAKELGERRWLAEGIWPERAYGVLAASEKVGKTLLDLDLAVSVASGKPWLGFIPVEVVGPVLIYLAEGNLQGTLVQLEAIARSKSLALDDLPIRITFEPPKLGRETHLDAVRWELAQEPKAVLVILDPLYLAATGVQASQLVDMGAALGEVQRLCEAAEAALLVAHHWNRREGSGSGRMSGAGPAEWGRVLLNLGYDGRTEADATTTDRDPEGHLRETKRLYLDVHGGEVAHHNLRYTRRITRLGDRPDSPIRYEVWETKPEEAARSPRPAETPAKPNTRSHVLGIINAAYPSSLPVATIHARLCHLMDNPPTSARVGNLLRDMAKEVPAPVAQLSTGLGKPGEWLAARGEQSSLEWTSEEVDKL